MTVNKWISSKHLTFHLYWNNGYKMGVFLLLAIISCESYSLSLTCSLFCAMLCISTVFTVARCLSVRLSRWCIVFTWLKISSNLFLGLDSEHRKPIPGEPLQQGHKVHGGWKILRFSTEITIHLGNGMR